MANRLFNIASALSGVTFGLTALAFLTASNVNARRQFITLSSSFHVSIHSWGDGPRVEVFNDSSYGPYSGSIIGVSSGKGVKPTDPKVSGIGDVAGIYYRMIRWRDGTKLWTLSLSLAYPLVFSALLPIAWLFRRSRRAHRGFPIEVKLTDK